MKTESKSVSTNAVIKMNGHKACIENRHQKGTLYRKEGENMTNICSTTKCEIVQREHVNRERQITRTLWIYVSHVKGGGLKSLEVTAT